MGEILLAIFLGWLLGGGKSPKGGGVQPIPPGKQPHPSKPYPKPAPGPGPEPIVPPPNTPGYEQPEKPSTPEPPPPPGEPKKEPVPNSYVPPGGWVPYMTPWTVQRATYYLGKPDKLPTGSAITETDPKGVKVKFRAESGKAHGDPKLKRAVTAWRQQQ